jgi:hypothetical protein
MHHNLKPTHQGIISLLTQAEASNFCAENYPQGKKIGF